MRFDTLLIANRGEIACRIIRSARAEGLRTVAVYTDADAGAPHVAAADDAVRIGAGPVGDSYLDGAKILAAAQQTGAQAIHPGYGFLSENADFAEAVAAAGLSFVGPSPEAIRAMGDKSAAKAAMIAAGVPCVPGYEGADQSDANLIAESAKVGFPVMVKASAGGGGRGMRRVASPDDLPEAITLARSEAENAFGSGHLILERAIDDARHVEIQIFADDHGTCIHLGERDCSVQRRHQKVIEEAPCPVMTPDLRAAMGAAAVKAARAVDYRGAGTVEFLLDANGAFYFLEMNTRLQVEHPVTEAVTGLDLVALQLRVAQGGTLGLMQDDVTLTGHAIEVRLYAEDPAADFMPATGTITNWTPPTGIRVDAGIVEGQEVSPFYDPMLAKLIAHGATRDAARQKLIRALQDTGLLGVATNRDFLIELLRQPGFAEGRATTSFMGELYPEGVTAPPADSRACAAAAALIQSAAYREARTRSPMAGDTLFGLGAIASRIDLTEGETLHRMTATPIPGGWQVAAEGWTHDVLVDLTQPKPRSVTIDGHPAQVHLAGTALSLNDRTYHFAPHRPWEQDAGAAGSGQICAPMPGLVISVEVAAGDTVEPGQTLAVVEAMKMQHQLAADIAGTVAEIRVAAGDQVSAGQLMISLTEDAS